MNVGVKMPKHKTKKMTKNKIKKIVKKIATQPRPKPSKPKRGNRTTTNKKKRNG